MRTVVEERMLRNESPAEGDECGARKRRPSLVAGSAWSQWRTHRTGNPLLTKGTPHMATTVNTRRRRYLTFMTAILAVSIISVASAAWLANGSGTGQADAGTAQALTVSTSEVTAVADVLYPNNDGNIRFVVTNPNPYNVDIASVTFGAVSAADGIASCAVHGVTFDNVTDLGEVVGAGSTLNVELVDHAHMSNESDTGCQDAEFTAPVAITGESTASAASGDDWS